MIFELVKEPHDSSMERRETHSSVLGRRRFIPEVDGVGEAIITEGITLEPIPCSLVGNPHLVSMMAFHADGLLIHCNILSTIPCHRTNLSNLLDDGKNLEERAGLSFWNWLVRVLDAQSMP
jgi:hypothetical protein